MDGHALELDDDSFMAYLIGGFANASSIIVGKAIGGNNPFLFRRACQLSARWGFCTALLLSIGILLFGEAAVGLFTTIDEVKVTVNDYLLWMMLFPIAGFWGLQLEGIFSGATDAKSVRDSISFALLLFLLAIWLIVPHYDNQGVWFAFVLFNRPSVFLRAHHDS
jgi:multidrug resistance protein, MATE family